MSATQRYHQSMITEVEAFFVDKMQAKADILKALEAKGISKREFDRKARKGELRCQRSNRFVYPPGCFSELGKPISETALTPRVWTATQEELGRKSNFKARRRFDLPEWSKSPAKR